MDFPTMNYFIADNSNNNAAVASMKRKHEQEPQEENLNSRKRMHLVDHLSPTTITTTSTTQTQQPFSLPSPPPVQGVTTKGTFQLSPNATANRANVVVLPPSTPPEDDIVMMEDEYTDEDEVLATPSATAVRYIAYDVGDDLDEGGYIGSLERGWSEMFNEMY